MRELRAVRAGGIFLAPRISVTLRSPHLLLFRKSERDDRRPGGDGDELLVVELIGHRRGLPVLVHRKAPQLLARRRIGRSQLPLSSPKITTPVAVLSTPPHEVTGPVCGSSHTTFPV